MLSKSAPVMSCGRSLRNGVLVTVLCVMALSALADKTACLPRERSVSVPIRVRLMFAGALPLFMRNENWSAEQTMLLSNKMSRQVRYPSADYANIPESVWRRGDDADTPFMCGVVSYAYSYEIEYVPQEASRALDGVLKQHLEEDSSMFAHATRAANSFASIITKAMPDQAGKSEHDATTYAIMVYNPVSTAPEYGYISGNGGEVGTLGVASSARFAFVDTGARPFIFDNRRGPGPGELLMAVSNGRNSYAEQLHAIVQDLITPPVSQSMRRFPPESRLSFKLSLIDASAVIGRISGVGGDSLGKQPLGVSFNSSRFTTLIHKALSGRALHDKNVSIEISVPDVANDGVTSMALARAFSMRGLDLMLDTDVLYRDYIKSDKTERAGYFVDSSFSGHIPLFLFSFADDSRVTHFEDGDEIHAKIVGHEAVLMIENRLRDNDGEHMDVTSFAAKETLELLCGVNTGSLAHADARTGEFPVILTDMAKRNILARELEWSSLSGADRACDLLEFDGYDRRVIPHGSNTPLGKSLRAVREARDNLYAVWDQAAISLDASLVEASTMRLQLVSRNLSHHLHEELCKQNLAGEILLELEGSKTIGDSAHLLGIQQELFYLQYVLFPALLGLVVGVAGFLIHRRQRLHTQSQTLGEVSTTGLSSTSAWFSTLTHSDSKSKVS